MRLTAEQFKKQYGEQSYTQLTAIKPKGGGLSDARQDFRETGTAIKGTFAKQEQTEKEISQSQAEGKTGKVRGFLQRQGTRLGTLSRAFGEGVLGVAKSLTPQKNEENFKRNLGTLAAPVVQSEPIQKLMANYEALPPEKKRDVDALLGVGSFLLDAAGAGVTRKVSGAIAGGAKEAASTAINATKIGVRNVAEGVGEVASEFGTNVKNKAAGALTDPIPQPVQEALKGTTPQRFDELADSARQAAVSNKANTPMELAGKKAGEALSMVKKKVDETGAAKREVTKGLSSKTTGSLAKDARVSLSEQVGKLGLAVDKSGNFVPKVGRAARVSDAGDLSLLKEARDILVKLGDNPNFQMMDDSIDALQDLVYKRGSNPLLVKVNSEVEGILKNVIGKMNSKLKSFADSVGVPEYAKLNSEFSRLNKVMSELNKKLGSGGERGGSLMKRVFSPSDARTKEMFAEIKKITGIDLTNEATLAKFLMETMGDVRQKSLLQQLQLSSVTTKRGALGWLIDKVKEKYNLPEETIRRAKELLMKDAPNPSPVAKNLDSLATEARKYKSAEEFVNGVDRQVVNKQLFGAKTGDVIEVDPRKLSIYQDSDLAGAKRQAPTRASEDFSKAPPIKVTITDKGDGVKWYIEDGHNRYIRALNEGKKIKAEITVGDFPVSKSYLTDFYNQATKGQR